MAYEDHMYRGRTLNIAMGTLILFLISIPLYAAASGDVSITKIGHFGGSTYAIHVSGNYAYITQGTDFVVLDISNKMAPVEVGRVETNSIIRDIALAGNYAYMADGSEGLLIVDVTNPEAPKLKGSYYTTMESYGVAAQGNYAYVVDGNRLLIVDVSNPEAPKFKGSYDTLGYSSGVAVEGSYAYVADGNRLVIVDVSDPEVPKSKGSYDTPGDSYDVEVEGSYAYVADGSDGLLIVNVSDPEMPQFKGSYDTPGYSSGVAVEGNYVYLADWSNLEIFDVSDPEAPKFKGNYYTAGRSLGVAVEGNYAYVTDYANGLMIVDVSNPTAPDFLGSYIITPGHSYDVAVEGNNAYVADGSNGLVIVDVTNPAVPNLKGRYDTAGDSYGVVVKGNYAYVADGSDGLLIVDVTNPLVPYLKGSYDTFDAYGVAVEGNYAYVADGSNGFVVVDVSDPEVPTYKGSYYTAGRSLGVAVEGNYVYINDYDNGLLIFDVSNPEAPNLISSYDTVGSLGVAVKENYAYVADGSDGLLIFDVSNPATPTLKGSYDTPWFNLNRVVVAGAYIYGTDNAALLILNVSDPEAPTLKGSYDTPGDSKGVAVAGNHAYVADMDNGLVIFQIDTPGFSRVHNINKGTDYNTIQTAIDDASEGDELHVDSGTYYENVNVNKKLILHGIGMPVVDARGSGSAITLAADGIKLEGFTATGASSDLDSGIKVTSNNNTVVGNNALNNSYGIYLYNSRNNKIYHNNFIDNPNQAFDNSTTNFWDNGYPSGGNYWSDYNGFDTMSGSNQDQNGSDGIGDTSYSIARGSSEDKYPLMVPSTSGTPVESITGEGTVYFDTITGIIQDLTAVSPDDILETPPQELNLNYGLFRFNITDLTQGGSTTLTLTFPEDLPAGTTYWKYGANTTNITPHWYTIPSTINGNTIMITLVDGGEGDDDLAANGMIKDDGGPSFPVIGVNIEPVVDCGTDKLKCENAGTKVQFNGSASYDPDGTIVSYEWEFGDGTTGTGAAQNHAYAAYRWNGSAYQPYLVNLTVTDDSNLTNRTSQNVTIWIAGDANGDGTVNILDASVVGLKWNVNDSCADLNNDGAVNILDANIVGLNWGKSAIIGG